MSSELELFLGDKFNPYGKSNRLLYQQIAWEQSKERLGYLAFVREVADGRCPGCDVLDCGTGWSGLALMDDGFKPSFVTDKNKFLKWRLEQRGIKNSVASRYPIVVSFDSLLLHKDPWTEIQKMASLGKIAIFNLHERWPVMEGTFAVDVSGLVEQVKNEFQVLSYKTYNHYAHLFAIIGTEQRKEQQDGE